jgi:hypothetical protein
MQEISEKARSAYHEAGHVFLGYNFRPTGIFWANISETGGRWGGDCRIYLADVPEESRAMVAVAGAVAEGRAAAIARTGSSQVRLSVSDALVTQILTFLGNNKDATQLDIAVGATDETIETSTSRHDTRWISAALHNDAAIRQALRDVCDCCNDPNGWRAIKAIAKLLHKEAPHRVFNIRMRLSIEAAF